MKVNFGVHTNNHGNTEELLNEAFNNVEMRKKDFGFLGTIQEDQITLRDIQECFAGKEYNISLILCYIDSNGLANAMGYKVGTNVKTTRKSLGNNPDTWHGFDSEGLQ